MQMLQQTKIGNNVTKKKSLKIEINLKEKI